MHACRFVAVALSSAVLVSGGARGSLGGQSKSDNTGCPSFHEVHPAITAKEALETRVPAGFKVYPSRDEKDEKVLLRENPIVSGGEVADAQPDFHWITKEPIVAFRFNAAGRRNFAAFTRRSIGRSFAIVLDGRAISVLLIREPIARGIGQITELTVAEAERLATKLKSGNCP